MSQDRQPSRREFGKTVAALAAVPSLAGIATAGDEPPATVADALFEAVKLRYGKQLTEAQLNRVKQSIQRGQGTSGLLRRTKLTNGDEPAFVFSADVP